MAGRRHEIELSFGRKELTQLRAISRSRTAAAKPGGAGANAAGLPAGALLLCGRAGLGAPSSDCATLHRAGQGVWRDDLARRPAAPWQGAEHHGRGEGLVRGLGVSQAKGALLSARTVDDAASGGPCARAWTDGGACLPQRAGPGHGVQDPRRPGDKAAQGALLPGETRSRLQREDGGGSVRLPQGRSAQKIGRSSGQAK